MLQIVSYCRFFPVTMMKITLSILVWVGPIPSTWQLVQWRWSDVSRHSQFRTRLRSQQIPSVSWKAGLLQYISYMLNISVIWNIRSPIIRMRHCMCNDQRRIVWWDCWMCNWSPRWRCWSCTYVYRWPLYTESRAHNQHICPRANLSAFVVQADGGDRKKARRVMSSARYM